jgi:hypothetical protein
VGDIACKSEYRSGNGAHHVMYTIYEVFLYLQPVTWFHGARVNVKSLTYVRKIRPSMRRFSTNSQMFNNICADFLYWMLPKSENKCEICIFEFIYVSEVKCVFHCIDMHESRNNATKFLTLFPILSKSEMECKK